MLDSRARQGTIQRAKRSVTWSEPDDVHSRSARVEWLSEELTAIRGRHEQAADFDGGLRALTRFRPHLGNPASVSMVRLLARWHEHRAWFAVHSGFTRTAIDSLDVAVRGYQLIYRETRDRNDLTRLASVALIGAHAHLYVNNPAESLRWLKMVRDVSDAGRLPLGSDYYRQLGTAYILEAGKRPDASTETASRVLAHVPMVMARIDEARSEAQLMFATRQRYLLGTDVNVEGCSALVEIAERCYRPDSLESVIAAHYRAAALLTTDSDHLHALAYSILHDTAARASRFPHQQAVSSLLSLTPRLQLTPSLRRLWVRQVSYLNPYRRF